MLKAASSTPGQLVASSALPGKEVDARLAWASATRLGSFMVGGEFLHVKGQVGHRTLPRNPEPTLTLN